MDPDRQDTLPSLTIIIVEQSFPLSGVFQFQACAIGIGHAMFGKQDGGIGNAGIFHKKEAATHI